MGPLLIKPAEMMLFYTGADTVGSGINAAGWVTGTYLDGNYASHAYVLIPSPERERDDQGEPHR